VSDEPTVVLLHGLARTHRSLSRLRKHLSHAGFATWSRTYPSRRGGVAELAAEVGDWLESDLGQAPIVGITHSMGGILARHIGDRLNWRGVLMLAPPNSGSRVAAALEHHPLYRWFFGPALSELADPSGWPPPPEPFAVIAGTGGATFGNLPSWVIRSKKLIPAGAAHDGTVIAAETTLPNMTAYAEVPASHTFIMNHPRTLELAEQFVRHRRFDGGEES
jgi:pimeloyl-ACP methyl ester carboxylesterase